MSDFTPETEDQFVGFHAGYQAGLQRGLQDGITEAINRVSSLGVHAEPKDERDLKFRTFEEAVTALVYLRDQVTSRQASVDRDNAKDSSR